MVKHKISWRNAGEMPLGFLQDILQLIMEKNENRSMITPMSFFAGYFFYFDCLLSTIYRVTCWIYSRANMQVLAFLELKQHFPNICPCNCFVQTGLSLTDMLDISYASINLASSTNSFIKTMVTSCKSLM